MKIAISVAAAVVFALALCAAILAAHSAFADEHEPTDPNCLPTSPDDPACLWRLELAKAEVAVEYEYPHCEVKLAVEHNLDELPDGVDGFGEIVGEWYGDGGQFNPVLQYVAAGRRRWLVELLAVTDTTTLSCKSFLCLTMGQ